MTGPVPAAGIVEAAAAAFHRTLVPDPRPWAKIREDLREYDRATARAVLAVVLPMVADEIGQHRMPTYTGLASEGFDLGIDEAAEVVRSLAEGLGDE